MTSPIVQYPRDQILQSDKDMGWKVSVPDEMPLQGPFIINVGLKVEMTTKNLEDYFFKNFNDCMFRTIADQSNAYARNRISSITCGRDLIVTSLMQKFAVHGYWSKKTLSHTPFFGKYLSCNKFQTILWHVHFNDVSSNPALGLPGHDPLPTYGI